jgi:hypothetical protein
MSIEEDTEVIRIFLAEKTHGAAEREIDNYEISKLLGQLEIQCKKPRSAF